MLRVHGQRLLILVMVVRLVINQGNWSHMEDIKYMPYYNSTNYSQNSTLIIKKSNMKNICEGQQLASNFKENKERIPVLLIRHAQSLQNEGKKKLLETLTAQEKANLNKNQKYINYCYQPHLLDADLSQFGVEQAIKAKQQIKNYDIDIVVVSPLRRALRTCHIIFSDNPNVKIFVQPLITQSFIAACDIGSNIQQSLCQYKDIFDFSKIINQKSQTWYVDLILKQANNEVKQKVRSLLEKEKEQKNIHLQILKMLKQHSKLSENRQLVNRCKQFKKQLLKYYNMSKKGIAVVGHYSIFKYLTSEQFDENYNPINSVQLYNAQMKKIMLKLEQ